jgi:hypothetical protein
MLPKASKWLVVVMLCVTLGFHWSLLQSAAWVGMMVDYSCQGSIKDAVTKTFDGQHPCPLCKLVREGKKSEKTPQAQQIVKKIDLFAGKTAAFYFPPQTAPAPPFSLVTVTRTEPPLLPPPRPFFG